MYVPAFVNVNSVDSVGAGGPTGTLTSQFELVDVTVCWVPAPQFHVTLSPTSIVTLGGTNDVSACGVPTCTVLSAARAGAATTNDSSSQPTADDAAAARQARGLGRTA